MGVEQIVLLNAADEAIGSAPKVPSHHRATPYHLAFSCFLVNAEGKVLITRRALDKRTFPGVWTGSCCGHPGPGESLREAVLRRLRDELGVSASELTPILPGFRYRATAEDGTLENERCPVVRALASDDAVRRDPEEVEDAEWWTWEQCRDLVDRPEASPWFRLQMAELVPLGSPLTWPDAGTAGLPPSLEW